MSNNNDIDTALLVRRLTDIAAKVSELNAEAESIKAQLRAEFQPGQYRVDGIPLKIIPTRRFDPVAGAALLTEEIRQACLAVTYDSAKVKAQLTPAQLEECMVVSGQPKVVL